MVFKDRTEAGQELAEKLANYKGKDVVVYALPRGGVPLGYEVATFLGCSLDLIIARKIGHPMNPEYAVCAVTEDGPLICNESERTSLDKSWLENAQESERAEAKRRRQAYLGEKKPADASGKVAIIIDDGVATGLTMFAAIEELKEHGPAEVVVAVPVLPSDTARQLNARADGMIYVDIPEVYMGSVSAYYESFPQLSDEEVVGFLRKNQSL